jgi:YtkA-like
MIAGLGLMLTAACSKTPSTTSIPATTSTTAVTSPASTVGTTSLKIPATGVKQAGDMRIWITTNPSPPKPGTATVVAYLVDSNGQPVDDAVLTYNINMTNMNMGTSILRPSLVSEGQYSRDARFSMAGPWRVVITIVRGGQTNTAAFDFTVTY